MNKWSYKKKCNIPAWATKDTKTTEISMTTPATIGFMPTPTTSLRLVLRPIAANAIDKKNFDKNDTAVTILSGTSPVLLMPTTARNPRINQGNIFRMFTFSAV